MKAKEVVTMCDGYRPLRDANKLLKDHGLVLRWRKGDCGGDQRLLRVEKLEEKPRKGGP